MPMPIKPILKIKLTKVVKRWKIEIPPIITRKTYDEVQKKKTQTNIIIMKTITQGIRGLRLRKTKMTLNFIKKNGTEIQYHSTEYTPK